MKVNEEVIVNYEKVRRKYSLMLRERRGEGTKSISSRDKGRL